MAQLIGCHLSNSFPMLEQGAGPLTLTILLQASEQQVLAINKQQTLIRWQKVDYFFYVNLTAYKVSKVTQLIKVVVFFSI